ncbi:MAG: ATP-binding cassette domain-containing protein [Planctomycetes bacterium]|nr:ATP-binding cassette domain-containing protein [Planctomycetota bacterium]
MIEFQGVEKRFPDPRGGEVVALRALDLVVRTGETHCLLGTSGCGKTTTLRLVNRLEQPSAGRVLVGGEDVATLDAYRLRRRIGYVIQTGGLFPHLTVAKNVGLLCELEGWSKTDTEQRIRELLALVNLPADEFAVRYPGELSGGQRQRVGVARALALDPAFVLMDEPFGALDPITRAQVHDELQQLLAHVHKTVLLVTHDLDEAFRLGDRISIMDQGELLQTGTPTEIAGSPANAFVAEFLAGRGTGGSSAGRG